LFSFFSTLTTAFSVYRGKTSISDFSAAGAVTGAFFTLNRGLPGAVSGGILGKHPLCPFNTINYGFIVSKINLSMKAA